jgi:ATP-binding cassette subfamily F protein uup
VRIEGFLERFLFPADEVRADRALSGGERNRVLLAKLLLQGATCSRSTSRRTTSTSRRCARSRRRCRVPGPLIVVSHDRWFLDRVATRILYLDGKGGARMHFGDMSGLLATLAAEREAPRARAPSRRRRLRARSASKPKRRTPWQREGARRLPELITAVETEIASLDERSPTRALHRPKEEIQRCARGDEVQADVA